MKLTSPTCSEKLRLETAFEMDTDKAGMPADGEVPRAESRSLSGQQEGHLEQAERPLQDTGRPQTSRSVRPSTYDVKHLQELCDQRQRKLLESNLYMQQSFKELDDVLHSLTVVDHGIPGEAQSGIDLGATSLPSASLTNELFSESVSDSLRGLFDNLKAEFHSRLCQKMIDLGLTDATDEPVPRPSTSKESTEKEERWNRGPSRSQIGRRNKQSKGQSGRSAPKKRITRKDRQGSRDVKTPTSSSISPSFALLTFQLVKSCNEMATFCDKLISEQRNIRATLLTVASRESSCSTSCFYLADVCFYISAFSSQLMSAMRNIVGCYSDMCLVQTQSRMLISTINIVTSFVVLLERNFKNLYTQYILRSLRDDVSAQPGKAIERFEEDSQSTQSSTEAGHSKKSEDAGHSEKKLEESGHCKKSEEAGHSKKAEEACYPKKKSEKSGHSEKKLEEAGHSKKAEEAGHSKKAEEACYPKKKSEKSGHSEKKLEEAGRSKKPEEACHSEKPEEACHSEKSEGGGHSKMMSDEGGRSSGKSEQASHSTRCKKTGREGQLSAISQQLDTVIEQLHVACRKLQDVPEPHGTSSSSSSSSSSCPPHYETDEHETFMKEKILKIEMRLTSIGERILVLASVMSALYRKNELNL